MRAARAEARGAPSAPSQRPPQLGLSRRSQRENVLGFEKNFMVQSLKNQPKPQKSFSFASARNKSSARSRYERFAHQNKYTYCEGEKQESCELWSTEGAGPGARGVNETESGRKGRRNTRAHRHEVSTITLVTFIAVPPVC